MIYPLRQKRQVTNAVNLTKICHPSIDSMIDPVDQPEYEARVGELRGEVGEQEFLACWAEVQVMDVDEAVEEGLGEV